MPTEQFVDLVKDALEHLYDPAHLRDHPLARLVLPECLPLGVGPAQALRQVLLDGIEQLNFSSALPSGARQNRAHQILVLRYVEALSFREVMAELSLSQPQFHRDQRHALEALAALLDRQVELTEGLNAPDEVPSALPSDLAELDAVARRGEGPTDLDEVIGSVSRMLAGVAAQADVTLRSEPPAGSATVRGNRTALRQLVIGLVGYVLCVVAKGELTLRATESEGVTLRAAYRGRVDRIALDQAEARDRLTVVSHLVVALGGTIATELTDEQLDLVVRLTVARRTLLVIDDNPDAVQFVTRLLAGQHYTVLSAGSVVDGVAKARHARPDVILLDIMLPEQDGWDAIQILKNDPTTQDVPVVVCTVLAEARLALALGAAEFIRKPLTRPRLLEALARWTTAPRLPGGARPAELVAEQPGGSPETAGR